MTENLVCKTYNRKPSTRTIVTTLVLAFVVSVLIMALAMLKIQVWPGGKFTLFTYDMSGQFAPVMASLRYIGKGDNSVFLSFSGALANNALLNTSAYMLDPMIWVTVLVPLERLPDAVYFITLIKIGLCAVSMGVYFFFGTKENKHPAVIVILSVCYALMSYNVMFSQCILWYNAIALAPIVLIGIERLIEGRRGFLYIFSMTLMLCWNSQLAYMAGIFSILYLLWRLSETGEHKWKTIGRFVICNALCVGLIMTGFLPMLFNAMGGRMNSYNPMEGKYFYYPLWDVLKQFLSCRYDTLESGGLPSVFCGTFVPLLAVGSVTLPNRKLRSRIISAGIIAFFVASFCFVPLNQFWHGFNEPNSFPGRYSFLLSLFLIILAHRTSCFLIEMRKASAITLYAIYGVAAVVASIELYLNASYLLEGLNIELGYEFNESYIQRVSDMKDVLKEIDDGDFYRTGIDLPYSLNEGTMFGFNGIGYFSSMFERGNMMFLGQLGFSQSEHTLMDAGGTPLTESLLGVRYKILAAPKLFGYFDPIYKNDSFELQYNKNALPLGFVMDYETHDPTIETDLDKAVSDRNSLAFQECILSEIRGERIRVFEDIDYTSEDIDSDEYKKYIRMRFTARGDTPVWMFVRDDHDGKSVAAPDGREPVLTSLSVNGQNIYPFVTKLSTFCTYLGTFRDGEEVVIEAACSNEFDDPWIAYYDKEECERALDEIKARGFVVTEHGNGTIKGRITIDDDDDLMIMTLPFMRGYHIKVDEEESEYGAYREALLALKMPPGEHTVEITFVPYGLVPGLWICLATLLMTFLYLAGIPAFGRRRASALQEE